MGKPSTYPACRNPSEEELQHSASVIRLLADPTRLGILSMMLTGDEWPVSGIAHQLGRPVPATSQHLAKLKAAGLVLSRREGTTIFYQLTGGHVAALVENLLQHTEHQFFIQPPHHQSAELKLA